jgi:tRNA threonylcarbamoyl adenosine modification protein (Sua5/YciO/YrdC/YwlC family)
MMAIAADEAALQAAADVLCRGLPVVVPTDTVYGLAANPARDGATDRLFAIKGRPGSVALPVLVANVEQAAGVAGPLGLPSVAQRLVATFWPGALTIVIGRRPGLGWELGGHDDTIGVRCPAHSWIRRLCARVGPLATTSANRHGEAPLTTASAVERLLGQRLALVVDGGTCDGAPSTVVDLTGSRPEQLRPGAVSWSDIEAATDAWS